MEDEPKTAPKFRRGCLRDCLNYLAQHPNRPITAEELAEKTGWDRHKVMHALTKSSWYREGGAKNTNPLTVHVEKLQTGMWRFVPQPTPDNFGEPKQPSKNEMLVEVLKERENYLLVEDLEDGKIYKMILVG